MPRTISPSLPSPPPLPMNAVQVRAVLTGKDLENYVEYPPFAASMTPMQIVGAAFGGSNELKATKYGMFQQWTFALPDFKWSGSDNSPDGKQGKTIVHLARAFWRYDPTRIEEGALKSTAEPVPPVGFTPVKHLTYVHGSNIAGKLEVPSGNPPLHAPLFAGLGMFVHLDTPYPDTDGKSRWFCVIPVAYFRVTLDRCIDEHTGSWVKRVYNPNTKEWEAVLQDRHYFMTLWLVVDDQRIRTLLIPSAVDPFSIVDISTHGQPGAVSWGRETSGVGVVKLTWPSGVIKTETTRNQQMRGGVPTSDKIELIVEHYVMHKRVPVSDWMEPNEEPAYLQLPLSRIAVILNGEWYEYDMPAAVLEGYSLSSYAGFGRLHGMVTAIFPATKDGYDLARNRYNMPGTVPPPYYYVNQSRPAIAIAYPVCKHRLGQMDIPLSVGYRPPLEQAEQAKMDAIGFIRPLFLDGSAEDEAGRPLVVSGSYRKGVIYDEFLGDTFWIEVPSFDPDCVISSVSLRMPGKLSEPRTIDSLDITPYISFASIRSQFVPSELREVQSVMLQLDAVDDHIVDGVIDTLMNKTGVFMLELEVFSNKGGIAYSDFDLDAKHHPCAYMRVQLPIGMEKQYRVQLSNRVLTIYAHDWFHFLANIPVRIAPFFDGWCWREAIRFLWELSGFPSDIWLFDDDESRCMQGPYPKQLDSNGGPIGECPHYKLPVGPTIHPIMRFSPEMSITQAIYQILTLLKRLVYYKWHEVAPGVFELRIATRRFRDVVDFWQSPNTKPIAIITTGSYSDVQDLAFLKDNVYGVPIVESGFLVIGQALWDIRTVGVAAGFNPIGYPVIESRKLNVWGVDDPNLSEQYLLKQQSPVFVAVPRPSIETDPIFVDPNAARVYLDYLETTNYPTNRISAMTPLLLFPIGSVVDIRRGETLYRRCWVAEVEHAIRRGGQSTTTLGLRLVQNVGA